MSSRTIPEERSRTPEVRVAPKRATGPRATLLAMSPVTERRLDLAGIPTAVLVGGEGPPMVLLHGQGEFGLTWMRTFAELVETHRVIVPDLPGHGESGVGDGGLDTDRALAWLSELIERTCDEPPTLAGHLLGGALAARFAAANPGRVRRLVLVETLGLSWFRPSPRFALAMVGFVARPTPQSQDRLFRRCMVDLDALRAETDGQMELLEAYALERAKLPELQAALRKLMPRLAVPPIPRADLEGMPVPTTLIHGRHGLQVSLGVAEAASERYGWPLHVIEDCADDPAVERPEDFLRALRSALRDS